MTGAALASTAPSATDVPLWHESFASTVPEEWGKGTCQLLSAGASTAHSSNAEDLLTKAFSLFEVAKDEFFEDGIETAFSRGLVGMIMRHASPAVDTIARLILSGKADPAVVAEALRWLGRINHFPSYAQRLWLLERCLQSSAPQIRDGAILGLASLDDPQAIKYTQEALQREPYPEMRQGLEHLLAQLQTTKQCHWY